MKIPDRQQAELIAADVNATGISTFEGCLTQDECDAVGALFDSDPLFRSTVEMDSADYGHGRYKYFAYPLPALVQDLRTSWYKALVPLAQQFWVSLGRAYEFPDSLDEFLAYCHENSQTRPTPLLLRYSSGGSNAPHQDRYGKVAFPLQVAIMLSDPQDYGDGSFVLHEGGPEYERQIRRRPPKGTAVVFPNQFRPMASLESGRCWVKHGVEQITWGSRATLGIIFHDARGRR